jgi:hypothetical protein
LAQKGLDAVVGQIRDACAQLNTRGATAGEDAKLWPSLSLSLEDEQGEAQAVGDGHNRFSS